MNSEAGNNKYRKIVAHGLVGGWYGGIAGRIVMLDTEYLFDKHDILLEQNRMAMCE